MYLYIQARNLKWHYPITVFKKLRSCLHTAESAPNLKFWPICDISVGYRDTILMYSGYCSLHPKHHTSYQDISCGFCFPSFILRTRLCLFFVWMQLISLHSAVGRHYWGQKSSQDSTTAAFWVGHLPIIFQKSSNCTTISDQDMATLICNFW